MLACQEDAATKIRQKLTKREKEVLQCLALGMNNREIATSLNYSIRTVRNHMYSIMNKLAVRPRLKLALYALKAEKMSQGDIFH